MFKCVKQIVRSNNFNLYSRKFFSTKTGNESALKLITKPLIFTIGFSAATITCLSICEYESALHSLSSRRILSIDHRTSDNDIVNQIKNWWNTRNDGFKVFAGIAAINVLVFCAWKINHAVVQKFMLTHFMMHSHINPVRCLPLILSTFSHYSLIHLSLNMIILYSISDIAVRLYGKYQFLSLYLCSGAISSFIGYTFKMITFRKSASLGASGAILGILSACCISAPNLEFMIIFFPFITFSAGTALKGLILFDITGLIFKFKVFDHATHLGGTFTGILYALYGQKLIDDYRKLVIKHWRSIKTYFRR